MDIVREFDINEFLFYNEMADAQTRMMDYLSECVALESGNMDSLRAISEGFMDKVKAGISKIVAKIKELFKKFAERVNEVVMTNESFLAKYKDTITKNPFKDHNVTMYNYDINKLENGFQVPDYNFNEFKDIAMAEDSEAEFISKYLNGVNRNGSEDIKEMVMNAIRGEEEKEMNMTELNPVNLYNFCANYKKNLDAIKKAEDNITRSESSILSELSKAANDAEKYESEQNKTGTDQGSGESKPEENKQQESAIYSSVYEGYLTELKVDKASDDKKPSGTQTVKTGGAKEVQINADVAKKDVDNYKNSDNGSSENLKKLQDGAGKYFGYCGQMISAKLTLLMAVYKDYMKLLKVHVRDYGGEGGSTSGSASQDHYSNFKIGDDQYKITLSKTNSTLKSTENGDIIQAGNDFITAGEAVDNEAISTAADKFVNAISVDKSGPIVLDISGPGNNYSIIFNNNGWYKAVPAKGSENLKTPEEKQKYAESKGIKKIFGLFSKK